MGRLGAHLKEAIRTGVRYAYAVDPKRARRWEVRWSP
jgi:hypothetical protein